MWSPTSEFVAVPHEEVALLALELGPQILDARRRVRVAREAVPPGGHDVEVQDLQQSDFCLAHFVALDALGERDDLAELDGLDELVVLRRRQQRRQRDESHTKIGLDEAALDAAAVSRALTQRRITTRPTRALRPGPFLRLRLKIIH